MRKFIFGLSIIFLILVSLTCVSAAFSSTLSPRYINRSVISGINVTVTAPHVNATLINITLPSTFSFVDGNQSTNLGTASFSNSSTNIWWNTTDDGFEGNTTSSFYFNVTAPTAGDTNLQVNVLRVDSNSNLSTLNITVNFDFYGYVKNETGGYQNYTNVSIYQFVEQQNAPVLEILVASTTTNASGFFNLTSINASANNFVVKTVYYNGSGIATKVGASIPPFPVRMYYSSGQNDMSLANSTLYLQPAATIRLYAHNTTDKQLFGYEVIDQKVGFPIASNLFANYSGVNITVPAGRSYVITMLREQSKFRMVGGGICNGSFYNATTCPSPPISNSSLGTINAGDILIVNQSLVTTKYRLYGCINTSAGHNNTVINVTKITLKLVAFETSSGMFVPPMPADQGDINVSESKQLNMSNSTGWATAGGVSCPGSLAAYNVSALGSSSGITYVVEVYAKNASSEADTHVGGNYLAAFQNVTVSNHTAFNLTLYKLLGTYVNDSISKQDANTSQMKINIVNESADLVTVDMHVEVSVKNSNTGVGTTNYMIETITNGTFYLPILNNTDWVKVALFPSNSPPMEKTLNLSAAENNITLVSIEPSSGGDKGLRRMNASGQLEEINASDMPIQLRFLRRGTTDVITEMNATDFNPLKALVAGQIDLEIKVIATNVTMKFHNFDMFSAKQPPMFAVLDNNSMSSTSQTWKFGNFVPDDVYDNVTLIIPYDDTVMNESYLYNMSIPALYKEDPTTTHQLAVAWNRTAGNTTSDLPDEFIDYNVSRYRNYLTSVGATCSKTDATSACYMNTTGNEIYMEIPHFSGLSPSVTGSAPGGAAAGNGGNGGSGVGTTTTFWRSTYAVSAAQFQTGYTKQLASKQRLRVSINDTFHYIGVVNVTNTTVVINVSSTPQQVTMEVGDEEKFELTNDTFYDLLVKLNSIADSTANLTIKSIHEEIPEEAVEEEEEEAVTPGEEGEEEIEGRNWLIWVIVIVIVVILAVVAYLIYQKKNM
jgi:hypothetical protein